MCSHIVSRWMRVYCRSAADKIATVFLAKLHGRALGNFAFGTVVDAAVPSLQLNTFRQDFADQHQMSAQLLAQWAENNSVAAAVAHAANVANQAAAAAAAAAAANAPAAAAANANPPAAAAAANAAAANAA